MDVRQGIVLQRSSPELRHVQQPADLVDRADERRGGAGSAEGGTPHRTDPQQDRHPAAIPLLRCRHLRQGSRYFDVCQGSLRHRAQRKGAGEEGDSAESRMSAEQLAQLNRLRRGLRRPVPREQLPAASSRAGRGEDESVDGTRDRHAQQRRTSAESAAQVQHQLHPDQPQQQRQQQWQ